jgi:hypothetical protein
VAGWSNARRGYHGRVCRPPCILRRPAVFSTHHSFCGPGPDEGRLRPRPELNLDLAPLKNHELRLESRILRGPDTVFHDTCDKGDPLIRCSTTAITQHGLSGVLLRVFARSCGAAPNSVLPHRILQPWRRNMGRASSVAARPSCRTLSRRGGAMDVFIPTRRWVLFQPPPPQPVWLKAPRRARQRHPSAAAAAA